MLHLISLQNGGFYKSKMAASRNSYFYESRLERRGMSHALQIFFVYRVNNAQFNFSVKMANFTNPRWPPAETVISTSRDLNGQECRTRSKFFSYIGSIMPNLISV